MATVIADYNVFPTRAGEIEECGKNFYNNITTAYKRFEDLGSSWQGERFHTTAEEFNKNVEGFNKIITAVEFAIPDDLRNKGTGYGSFDTFGNFSAGSSEAAHQLEEIDSSTIDKLVFNRDKVTMEEAEAIVKLLKDAQENITSAKEVVDGMINKEEWAGEAASRCQKGLENFATQINEQIDELAPSIRQTFQEAIDEVNALEAE